MNLIFIRRRWHCDNFKIDQSSWKWVLNLAFVYLSRLLLKCVNLLKAACSSSSSSMSDRWDYCWYWSRSHSFLCKQVIAKYSVHCEHMNSICLEHFLHVFITNNVSLVWRILKFMSFYIVSEHLDDLRTRKLKSFSIMWFRFA